jgi:PhnB protein
MPKRTKSRNKRAARKSVAKKQKLAPIPSGFRTITPYLSVEGAADAIDFYKKAFGAKEIRRDETPDGKIMNAILKIGDSMMMLSDNMMGPQPQGSPVTIHLYSKDVDKLWGQAMSAGATETVPLDNQFWGERYGQLTDPFGHKWSMSMQVRMSKEERDTKQKAAMAMFSQGQQSGAPAGTA